MVIDASNVWWIAPLLGVIGVVIGALLVRRTGKEANGTNQFTAITNALFARAEQQDTDIAQLRKELEEVKTLAGKQAIELENVKEELDKERAGTKELKRVNAALVRYVGKLSSMWPSGTTLPTPDDDIEMLSMTRDRPKK